MKSFWEALAQCPAQKQQSINGGNYYRVDFVSATFFLGKQLFVVERLWHGICFDLFTMGKKKLQDLNHD